jgi:membrane-anchored protein YejM (alkaline phosphatase superfamily)
MKYDDMVYSMVSRRKMVFPPENLEEEIEYGRKLHQAQIEAVEYLDSCLPILLHELPFNTIVLLLADHGEAFGEDGYWGHGIYHPKIMEVPFAIFSLDGRDIEQLLKFS